MLLARWGSNTILRYLKEAPLKNLTAEYKAGVNKTLEAVTVNRDEHIKKISDKALAKLKNLETKIREQEAALRALADKMKPSDYDADEDQYIVSHKYQKWHRVSPWKGSDRQLWRCPCGWAYGNSIFEISAPAASQ